MKNCTRRKKVGKELLDSLNQIHGIKNINLEANNINCGWFSFNQIPACKVEKLNLTEDGKEMNYTIREMKSYEYKVLKDFLYEAIYIPEGVDFPQKTIIEQPELQIYISEFGNKDDNALVAEVDGKIVGAVWTRIMNDYGHIDNDTPSFAISLYKEYRGLGIGTDMMNQMLTLLKNKGYKQASLAVQQANYAVKMYQKVGFEIIDKNEEEYIMRCSLK